MNKSHISPAHSESIQNIKLNNDLITRITYFFTLIFIFLIPWGDGLWDGTPRIAATISLGFSVILFLTKGTHRNYTFTHLLIVLFFTWQLISVVWSPDQVYGIQVATTGIQLLLLVFLVTIVFDSNKKIISAYQVYVLGNIVGSFIIINNYLNGIMSFYYGRYGIVNIETDTLAIILALSIPLAAYLATQTQSRLIKIVNIVGIPIIFYGIFLTGSRTGPIVGLLGIFYWIFSYRRSSFLIKLVIAFLLIGSVIAVFTLAPKESIERVFSAGKSIHSGTLNGRTIIWRKSIESWKESPLIGTGLGGLGYALSNKHSKYRSAHNSYIHILTVNGIIGLILYILIIASLFYYVAHRTIPFEDKIFLSTLLLCLIVSQITTHTQAEKYLWVLFTLIVLHTKLFSTQRVQI